MSRKALPLSLLIVLELSSAGSVSIGAPAPKVGRLEYDLIYREPVSTIRPSAVVSRPGSSHPPQMRIQRSRHQIWFKGPLLRVDMTSQPPGTKLARAANVSVNYLRSDGKPGVVIVPDGCSLIRNAQGTFIFRRGSGYASRLTSRQKPFPIHLSGTLPSLPIIDRPVLSRRKPGKVGAE